MTSLGTVNEFGRKIVSYERKRETEGERSMRSVTDFENEEYMTYDYISS